MLMSLRKYLTSTLLFASLSATALIAGFSTAHAEMSKGEAASKAKSAHSGKVLSVELIKSQNGRDTYRVKLLMPDGRVKTVTVSG